MISSFSYEIVLITIFFARLTLGQPAFHFFENAISKKSNLQQQIMVDLLITFPLTYSAEGGLRWGDIYGYIVYFLYFMILQEVKTVVTFCYVFQ